MAEQGNVILPEQEVPDYVLVPQMKMPEETVDGIAYIGVLEIPDLGLNLPVASNWSYPLLRQTPCRYTGSAYTNDLVIAAHNYDKHFGGLKNLQIGDSVTFTDMDGDVFFPEFSEDEWKTYYKSLTMYPTDYLSFYFHILKKKTADDR